jgi:hypothetical protein
MKFRSGQKILDFFGTLFFALVDAKQNGHGAVDVDVAAANNYHNTKKLLLNFFTKLHFFLNFTFSQKYRIAPSELSYVT